MRSIVTTISSFVPAFALALLVMSPAQAADDPELEQARKKLTLSYPNLAADDINRSPIDGFLELRQGAMVAYVSMDGRFLVQGEIFDLLQDRNLTQESVRVGRVKLIAGVKDQDSVIFGADKADYTVTVFTDIDCTYCRKLHREIDTYTKEGIKVRYLLYPRSGPNTRSWEKAEEVWCADDRNTAMTKAKNDQSLPAANCDADIIMAHFELGLGVGLTGTPTIITPGGDIISGYVPAAQLRSRLDAEAALDAYEPPSK